MRFRLVFYDTHNDNKYDAFRRMEYLGNKEDIWQLWYLLHTELNFKHVEVYNLSGMKCQPENGLHEGMIDYNV